MCWGVYIKKKNNTHQVKPWGLVKSGGNVGSPERLREVGPERRVNTCAYSLAINVEFEQPESLGVGW